MEEGSLRVDANVSVRRAGTDALGAKTEIKNVNSFSGVEKALELEIARQVRVLEAGGRRAIRRRSSGTTTAAVLRSMRSKEESHDYRYFPEPDLPPLVIPAERRSRRRATSCPSCRGRGGAGFVEAYGLSDYDAGVLTQSRATADYFEAVARSDRASPSPRRTGSWGRPRRS